MSAGYAAGSRTSIIGLVLIGAAAIMIADSPGVAQTKASGERCA
jgi:hypothetical protein